MARCVTGEAKAERAASFTHAGLRAEVTRAANLFGALELIFGDQSVAQMRISPTLLKAAQQEFDLALSAKAQADQARQKSRDCRAQTSSPVTASATTVSSTGCAFAFASAVIVSVLTAVRRPARTRC